METTLTGRGFHHAMPAAPPSEACNTPLEMLDCREVAGSLCGYLGGDLALETINAIEEHLDNCWQCRWVADSARRTLSQMG